MSRWMLLALGLGLAGCGLLTSPLVGEYNDSAEVLTGEVVFDPLGGDGTLLLAGERTGLQCEGDIWVTKAGDDPINCGGMSGDFSAFCDDGRRLDGDWRARSCAAGVATGKDTRGENMSFFFGVEAEAAERFLAAARRRADLRPPLDAARPGARAGAAGVAGFFVDIDGGFVTAAARFTPGADVMAEDGDGRAFSGRILAVDRVNGVAIGAMDGASPALPLAAFDAAPPGAALNALTPSGPIVGSVDRRSRDPRALGFSGALDAEDAGAPVIDAEGRVVGFVATTAWGEEDAAGRRAPDPRAMRISYALALLAAAERAPTLRDAGGRRFDTAQIADAYRPALLTIRPR